MLEWDVYYSHIFDATGSNGSMANSEMFKFDNVGNSKLRANWSINSYEAKFDGNGGSNGSSKVIEYSSPLGTLPTISRPGYTFIGWFTETSGGQRIDANTRLYEDTTYYAQWQV